MNPRSLRLLTMATLVCTLAGCEGEPRRLGWEMRFANAALNARAAAVQARIRRGTCVGEIVFSVEISRGETLGTVDMPVLEDGPWAFEARARDATCSVFAEGCAEEDLPITGPVAVVLMERSPVQACSPTTCSNGRCDGGTGMDGGVGCAASETDCGNRVDDDCDGDRDCADSDCGADPGCAACTGVMCPECMACESGGTCGPAPEGEACTGGSCHGASCCTGCWDGTTCQSGATDTACGSGGVDCSTCGECGSCDGASCVGSGATEGMPCNAGAGVCAMGVCCMTCVDVAGACQPGNTAAACGSGAGMCADCGECGQCIGASCTFAAGATCPGGICNAGTCCRGCIRAGTCEPGDQDTTCGFSGSACIPCMSGETCVGGACVTDPCPGGRLRGSPPTCCTGCFDGSACQPGNADGACGSFGMDCFSCPRGTTCNGRFCEPSGTMS